MEWVFLFQYYMNKLVLLILVFVFVACNNEAPSVAAVQNRTDGLDLSATDSIELYHYADPKDQKKFYKKFITDTGFIQQVIKNLQEAGIEKTSCENDFKMFLYRNGEVYKTIYAATPDSCRYYAYIIDGITYFKPLDDSAVRMLKGQLPH